jgi:HEAT repeat protein
MNSARKKTVQIVVLIFTGLIIFSAGIAATGADNVLRIEKKQALENLKSNLKDLRIQGAEWFSRHAQEIGNEAILKTLKKEQTSEVIHYLLDTLRIKKAPESAAVFLRYLAYDDRLIRQDACYGLHDIASSGADEALARLYKTELDRRVKLGIVYALSVYRTNSALQTLYTAVSDKEPDVQKYAAQFLFRMNDPRADELLSKVINPDIPEIKQMAQDARQRIAQRKKTGSTR